MQPKQVLFRQERTPLCAKALFQPDDCDDNCYCDDIYDNFDEDEGDDDDDGSGENATVCKGLIIIIIVHRLLINEKVTEINEYSKSSLLS